MPLRTIPVALVACFISACGGTSSAPSELRAPNQTAGEAGMAGEVDEPVSGSAGSAVAAHAGEGGEATLPTNSDGGTSAGTVAGAGGSTGGVAGAPSAAGAAGEASAGTGGSQAGEGGTTASAGAGGQGGEPSDVESWRICGDQTCGDDQVCVLNGKKRICWTFGMLGKCDPTVLPHPMSTVADCCKDQPVACSQPYYNCDVMQDPDTGKDCGVCGAVAEGRWSCGRPL